MDWGLQIGKSQQGPLGGSGAALVGVKLLLLGGLSQTRVLMACLIHAGCVRCHEQCRGPSMPSMWVGLCRSPYIDAVVLKGSMHPQPACITAADQASHRPSSAGQSCCLLGQPRQAWGQAAMVLQLEHCFSSPELWPQCWRDPLMAL